MTIKNIKMFITNCIVTDGINFVKSAWYKTYPNRLPLYATAHKATVVQCAYIT